MANKYSEELFGAVDAIVKKRLEELNKDSTILCKIEDNKEAEEGKYTVSNNALRFTAFSEKTDYAIGQNVWVLVPDGNYENTKLIMGKYVSSDTTSFTWVSPLSSFIDVTDNLISQEESATEYGLVANDDRQGKNYIAFNNGLNIIRTDLEKLQNLNRIGIRAKFRTSFPDDQYAPPIPVAGDYGIRIKIETDKPEKNDNYYLYPLTSSEMFGNPYGYQEYSIQEALYQFDPKTIGNVTAIYCEFYQSPKEQSFVNENGLYPWKINEEDYYEPNLFIKDLEIMMGYSSEQFTGTTALLWTDNDELYNSMVESSSVNEKTIHFRFVFKETNNEYTFVNTHNELQHFYTSHPNFLSMRLYYQDTSQVYDDLRAGDRWHEIKDFKYDNVGTQGTPVYKFQTTLNLLTGNLNKQGHYVRFKTVFCFRNENAYDKIAPLSEWEEYFKDPANGYHIIFSGYTQDEIDAIQLFLNSNFARAEIYGDNTIQEPEYKGYWIKDRNEDGTLIYKKSLYKILQDINVREEKFKYLHLDYDEEQMPQSGTVFWNYLALLKQQELELKNGNSGYPNFFDLVNENYTSDDQPFTMLSFLQNTFLKEKWASSENNSLLHFDQIKSKLETLYHSNILVFTDVANDKQQIMDLIQGLRLTPTDDKNGIYNLYKATENANSNLIRSSDASVKRNIEATFKSTITNVKELDSAPRIYWLMPRYNSMIKEPLEGVNFGSDFYNAVKYTQQEFDEWKGSRKTTADGEYDSSDGKDLYYLTIVNNKEEYKRVLNGDQPYDKGIFYTRSKEILLVEEITDAIRDNSSYLAIDSLKDEISQSEYDFLKESLNNYWIIVEDRTESSSDITYSRQLGKASLTYQIKPTYRKSLNNNRIYAMIYKTDQMYTAYCDLFFGVKGTNGTDYTLSLVPIEEKYYTENDATKTAINNSPTVWTKRPSSDGDITGNTESLTIQVFLYDANDKEINTTLSTNYRYTFKILPENNSIFSCNSTGNKVTITQNSNSYMGGILECHLENTNMGINLTQYYIIPIRTDKHCAFLEGPDIITYNTNGTSPEYYNIAYALKTIDESDIVIDEMGETSNENDGIVLRALDNSENNKKYLPTVDATKTLVPKTGYTNNVNYNCYLEIKGKINSESGSKVLWYQPILIVLNTYANTTINSIKEGLNVKTSSQKSKAASTIMNFGTKNNDGSLTGIIAGSLPVVNDEETRAGILGYNKDTEVYGFLDDGTGFIGSKKAQAKFADDEWSLFCQKTGEYEKQLMKLSESEKYLRSANYDPTSNPPVGLSINLENGEITGLTASDIPAHIHTIADIYWNNGTSNLVPKNTVLAGPTSGNNAKPTFRTLSATDISNFTNAVINVINTNYASLNTNATITHLTINGTTYRVEVGYSFGLGSYLRLVEE